MHNQKQPIVFLRSQGGYSVGNSNLPKQKEDHHKVQGAGCRKEKRERWRGEKSLFVPIAKRGKRREKTRPREAHSLSLDPAVDHLSDDNKSIATNTS